jgi:hypothetical protein
MINFHSLTQQQLFQLYLEFQPDFEPLDYTMHQKVLEYKKKKKKNQNFGQVSFLHVLKCKIAEKFYGPRLYNS